MNEAPRSESNSSTPLVPDVPSLLARHRGHVRAWLIAAIALWFVAAGFLFAWLGTYLVYLGPKVHDLVAAAASDQAQVTSRIAHLWLAVLLCWPVLLLLAGGATVGLLVSSRRVALRQIQASLADISAELARLREAGRS